MTIPNATAALTIREATLADEDGLVALALDSWPESPFAKSSPNDDQIRAAVRWFLTSTVTGGWVMVSDEAIVGVLGVVLTNHLFDGRRIATQWWWWIRPEARGSGVLMLRQAEQWARIAGAAELHLLAPNDQLRKLCEGLKYTEVETTYAREL